MPMFHPAAALHQPRLWADMLEDWEHKVCKVDSDFTLSDKVDKVITEASLDVENDPDGWIGEWSMAYRGQDGKLTVVPYKGVKQGIYYPETLIFHNAKYDLKVIKKNGMPQPKNVQDTMIAAYCLIPSTKVLRRDLQWVEIGSLKIGDDLIGIDEIIPQAKEKRGRRLMSPSKVLAIARRNAPCYKLTLSNGKIITCTAEHPWLTRRLGSHAGIWRETKKLRVGWAMTAPIETWEINNEREAGYLAGIIDGEGSITKFDIQIAQKQGLVLDRTKKYLDKLGYRYTQYTKSDHICDCLHIWGLNDVIKILGSIRPSRLLSKETWIGRTPTRQTMPTVRIVSIESVGVKEVVSIETSTHTFNAEGFWTHNCLGLGKQAPKDSGKSKSGSDMVGGLGLKYLARRQLGMTMKTWEQIKNHPEEKAEYNANDSVATYLLWEKWKPELPWIYWNIDMPLLGTIMAIEDRGIAVDPQFLKKYAESLDSELSSIELPFTSAFTNEEIMSYIYGTLGYEPWKFTETGMPSVDSDVLETIDDPVINNLLKYKELYKERNTYAKGYQKGIDSNGRIHTELKQVSTSTGRLSSANPNLQNVVKEGYMRTLFISPEGKILVRLDYSLLEFGALAVLAKDERLIEAFVKGDKKKGTDVHSITANGLGTDRDTAKHINFLMQNGGTAWGISSTYKIPIGLANEYYAKYYQTFPALKRFQDETVAKALETKHVTGYFGRTRRIDSLFSTDWRIRKEGEKEAKTMPMQNLGAEIVKIAMNDLHYKHSAPMLLQVHDELLFEVDEKDGEEYAHWLKEYVPHITEIDGVQFPVSIGWGRNWKEASEDKL